MKRMCSDWVLRYRMQTLLVGIAIGAVSRGTCIIRSGNETLLGMNSYRTLDILSQSLPPSPFFYIRSFNINPSLSNHLPLGPLPAAPPALDAPLAIPDGAALGIPRALPLCTACPPLGFGVPNLELTFDDAGGCSTKLVSVVLVKKSAHESTTPSSQPTGR
jgi:hypothetical protein